MRFLYGEPKLPPPTPDIDPATMLEVQKTLAEAIRATEAANRAHSRMREAERLIRLQLDVLNRLRG